MNISESLRPPLRILLNPSFYGKNWNPPLLEKFQKVKPVSFKKVRGVQVVLTDGETIIDMDLEQLKFYMDTSILDRNHPINPFHAAGFLPYSVKT